MVLAAADALLTPVTTVDGFVLACLADASTGTVIAAAPGRDPGDGVLQAMAADATDIVRLLSILSSSLTSADQLEDIVVTRSDHLHLIRPVPPGPGRPAMLLLVVLDRTMTNLALARREAEQFCESLALAGSAGSSRAGGSR